VHLSFAVKGPAHLQQRFRRTAAALSPPALRGTRPSVGSGIARAARHALQGEAQGGAEWFDGDAEDAASFYVTLLPNSRIDRIFRSPADTPSGPAGSVLTVEFTLAGIQYVGLNGGPEFNFTEAVSFQIHCDDQQEVDRLRARLLDGGAEIACGWINSGGA